MEANVPIEHFYLPGDQDDYESMMHETVRWVNASLGGKGNYWNRRGIEDESDSPFPSTMEKALLQSI
ncbi:MAG: hypothetical protein Ct9H90mP1_2770 [Methanobacteriota archaeon]|nr:MAG: hypothetical protein Ct9H90mP1_2770 [Euryarchaeota archaeon]